MDQGFVGGLKLCGDRAHTGIGSDLPTVDREDWRESTKGARDKGLVGGVAIEQREVLFSADQSVGAAQLDHFLSGDPVHAELIGARPDFALLDDEKIGGIAGGDKSIDVEHQGLISSGFQGLHQRLYFMKFAVAVEFGVQVVRAPSSHGGSEKPQAASSALLGCDLVFGNDHHIRAGEREPGVLGRRFLDASGDHDTNVHAIVHIVGLQCLPDVPLQFLFCEGKLQSDRFRSFPETLKMILEETQAATVQSDPFPNAITYQIAAVKNRYAGLSPRHERTIDVDEHIFIAPILLCIVRSVGHVFNSRSIDQCIQRSTGPHDRFSFVFVRPVVSAYVHPLTLYRNEFFVDARLVFP